MSFPESKGNGSKMRATLAKGTERNNTVPLSKRSDNNNNALLSSPFIIFRAKYFSRVFLYGLLHMQISYTYVFRIRDNANNITYFLNLINYNIAEQRVL